MKLPVRSIEEVRSRQLCTGCGVCASVEPSRFRMGDALEHGRRPFLVDDPVNETGDGLKVCPGASLEHTFDRSDPELIGELTDAWGPRLRSLGGPRVRRGHPPRRLQWRRRNGARALLHRAGRHGRRTAHRSPNRQALSQ